LGNSPRAEKMGKAGRQFVLENFTWEQVTAKVYRAYQKASGLDS